MVSYKKLTTTVLKFIMKKLKSIKKLNLGFGHRKRVDLILVRLLPSTQEKLEMRKPEYITKLIKKVNKMIQFRNILNEQQQIWKENFENKSDKPERLHRQENSFPSRPKTIMWKEVNIINERNLIIDIGISPQIRIRNPPSDIAIRERFLVEVQMLGLNRQD